MLHFSRGNLLQAETEAAVNTVRSLIETTLGDLSDVEVAVYEPVSRPER
jgi:hypothetical protein